MKYFLNAFEKYAVFTGRSDRKDYWYFSIFNIVFTIILGFIDQLMGTFVVDAGYGPLSAVYTLAAIIPGISVSVRRLHDTGRVGWWFFITLVPLIGLFVFIYFMASPGERKTNKFGNSSTGYITNLCKN